MDMRILPYRRGVIAASQVYEYRVYCMYLIIVCMVMTQSLV